MNTAINEACIENCHLVRGIFLVWEISIFLLLGRIFPIYRVSPKQWASPYMVGATSKMKGWVRLGKTEDMIRGDNFAGHCCVQRDLIPINIFK